MTRSRWGAALLVALAVAAAGHGAAPPAEKAAPPGEKAAPDPSGFGEGARYLGAASVTTDGDGNARFDLTLSAASSEGEVVTATATDPDGNTSEFSAAVPVTLPGSISGVAFVDFNANGVPDTGEPGLPGHTFFLDLNHDGLRGVGEPTSLTDAAGRYQFPALAVGSYTVREME